MAKGYYQVLISVNKNRDDLVLWSREKLEGLEGRVIPKSIIMKKLPIIKNYKSIKDVIGFEISEENYHESIKYKNSHNDIIVVDEEFMNFGK